MNESEAKRYKSPRRKLVKFFEQSRNQWKAKSIAAKAQVKYLKNPCDAKNGTCAFKPLRDSKN